MVIEMIEKLLEKAGIVPQWKKDRAACEAFVAEQMRLYGEELRKRMRATYPRMDAAIMDEHIRLELEHNFYIAVNHARKIA